MSERDELAALRVLNVELQEVTGKVMHDLVGMRAERDALRAQVARLREGLTALEWYDGHDDLLCPSCRSLQQYGHSAGCPLAQLLAAPPSGPDPAGDA